MANHRGKNSETSTAFTGFGSLLSILLQPEEKIRDNQKCEETLRSVSGPQNGHYFLITQPLTQT